MSSVELLREIRKSSTLAKLPRPTGSKLQFHKTYHWDNELQAYHVPFVFADPSVVRLSQQLFLTGCGDTPFGSKKSIPPTIQFAAYTILPSFTAVILYYLFLIVFGTLASMPWGRSLLLKYPEFFSFGFFTRDGPTDQQLQETSFEVLLRAKGYPNKSTPSPETVPNVEITTKVHGPEPGYVATPRIACQAALTLLEGKQKQIVPFGVLTPCVAFWQTNLVDRLHDVGIEFERL